MTIPDSITLKKAMKIAAKIERLQQKLHELLGATLEPVSYTHLTLPTKRIV